ncbi:MAG: YkgJ family cysteine cluster protein [Deltaproteobacteria bacterium]|nr:YkgJ family cysteine cluster protein [Deltaproteobacteria bacterium]
MPFQLDAPLAHPPKPHFAWPLRALAFCLRRVAVFIAIIGVWQRVILRRAHGIEWTLDGTCKSCGRCCENLMLPSGKLASWRIVVWLRRFWHEGVNDFYPKAMFIESEGRSFQAYGCRNWTAEKTCARYTLRPFVCRVYPALALLDRPTPAQHCGYRVRERLRVVE